VEARLSGLLGALLVALLVLPSTPAFAAPAEPGQGLDAELKARVMLEAVSRVVEVLEGHGFDVSKARELVSKAREAYVAGDYGGAVKLCLEALRSLRGVAEGLKREGDGFEPAGVAEARLRELEGLVARLKAPEEAKRRILDAIAWARGVVEGRPAAWEELKARMRDVVAEHAKELKRRVAEKAAGDVASEVQRIVEEVERALGGLPSDLAGPAKDGVAPILPAIPLEKMAPEQAAALLKGLHEVKGAVAAIRGLDWDAGVPERAEVVRAFGVVAWIPDNTTLIVVGIILKPVAPAKPQPQERPPLPEPPAGGPKVLVVPMLRVFKVDTSEAAVKGAVEIGKTAAVFGKLAGMDWELKIPVIKADMVIVGAGFKTITAPITIQAGQQ